MTRSLLLFALLSVGVCTGSALAASASKGAATGTLKDLKGREVLIEPDTPVNVTPGEVIRQYERVLELPASDPRLRAEALRRLGDLKLEIDEDARGAEVLSEASPERLAEAIRIYESLISSYPEAPRNDMVLYQLARAYEADGRPDQALAVLDRLVREYPRSVRLAEAQFRRGEIHFSNGRYAESDQAYAAVVSLGIETGFYEQGLYKQGWALFKQARSEQSTTVFMQLLDRVLVEGGLLQGRDSLSRPERELSDDALRALAVTFADAEGPATLDTALSRGGLPVYAHLMYGALGDLYLEQERYQDAALAYAAFVKQSPDDTDAPLLQVRAIEAYQKGGFDSLVLDGKRDFVQRYALTSTFWASRTPAEAPEVVAVLKTNLQDLARYHHSQAQKSGNAEDYVAAARWYGALLDSFPTDVEAPATRFLLSEVLFEGGRFAEAAAEYGRTAYDYPLHPQSAKAGYAALIAYEREEARLPVASKASWHRQAIDSQLMFATTFVEHPESGRVLTKAAEELFALNEFDRTIDVARQALERRPPLAASGQRTAATLLAHSLFDRGRYVEAEEAYLRVQFLLPAGDPELAATVERLAASIYKQAEAKQAEGATAGAVDDFLRVATLAPTAKVRANAEFDAASLLLQQREWVRATEVLVGFRRAHPDHELGSEVTRSLALAYLESGRGMDAAPEFEKIAASKSETEDVRRAAQLQAAELYEKAGDARLATTAYTEYVLRFPVPLDAAMDARQRLVDLSVAARDTTARTRWLEELVRADQVAGAVRTDRSRYLAARASLALTEPAVAAFNGIRLVAPLDKSLKTKRTAMESVLASFSRALDYQVAEVTTAATFGMAEVYRQLATDLMASERPADLDADAREQYDVLLEEQAFPFEEQSIELHQANSRRASEGVYDQWVQRSFEVLAKLMPVRYAKVELSEDYVPTLR